MQAQMTLPALVDQVVAVQGATQVDAQVLRVLQTLAVVAVAVHMPVALVVQEGLA